VRSRLLGPWQRHQSPDRSALSHLSAEPGRLGRAGAILPFFALSWLFEGPELIASSLLNIRWQGVLCVLYLSFIATWLGYGLWGGC
jgi:hypothetical protein